MLRRLVHDRQGNAMALIAASLVPLLAMVGGGIDMGRSYLAQSRLQQACDAGVLAARKKIGSTYVANGIMPADAQTVGDSFFNLNFRDGAYGTEGRQFDMTLEEDMAVSGEAVAQVPTSIMGMFGYDDVDLKVNCEARINFSNTDIMFVLDVTGSMAETNPGDSASRINSLKSTVKAFRNQIKSSAASSTRLRFGFVPYSTNVNVGGLLEDDWVVDNWQYQSRERFKTGHTDGTRSYDENWVVESGTWGSWTVVDSYAATYHPEYTYYDPGGTTIDENENVVVTPAGWRTVGAYYSCDGSQPNDTVTESNKVLLGTTTEPYVGPPVGTKTIEHYRTTYNGTDYRTRLSGSTCNIEASVVDNWTATFDWVTIPTRTDTFAWRYAQLPKDVKNWRNQAIGCVEERATYEITDYSNVDFNAALDLNLDLVPTADDATKWRPMYPDIIYDRAIGWNGAGSFSPAEVTTEDEYLPPNAFGLAACPPESKKLQVWADADFDAYVDALRPNGSTYHDIGMIWGGRLISPTGLFAAENADVNGRATSRNLIFLTDGETSPLDLSYTSYGVEPLDQRRWSEGSAMSLTETVEARFLVACSEVKKRNVTIWLIAFGTNLTPTMTQCAGDGHYFQAADAGQLSDIFDSIAARMGDLRISK